MTVLYAAAIAALVAIGVNWVIDGDGMVAVGQVVGAFNTVVWWLLFESLRSRPEKP